MIIIEKPRGCTINQFINKYKNDNNIKKLCFCGRLDPMARGKILILIDEECKMMPKYLSFDKTYQFEICFGFQTDTDDFLGLIENQKNTFLPININCIINYINSLSNYTFEQSFHKYSSKKVNGKTLREQKIDKYPTHKVTIYKTNYLGIRSSNFISFIENIIKDIKSIDNSKDFRQSDIIKQWKNISRDLIFSIKYEFKVSSGFYVRQFVRDLSNKFNHPMIVYDINRVRCYYL